MIKNYWIYEHEIKFKKIYQHSYYCIAALLCYIYIPKKYFLKWVSTYSFISKLNSLTTFDFNMFEFHFLFLKKSKMFSEQTANQLYQRNRGSDTRKVFPMIRLFPSRWWLFCRSYRMRLDSQTWGGPKQAAKQGHHVCQQVH